MFVLNKSLKLPYANEHLALEKWAPSSSDFEFETAKLVDGKIILHSSLMTAWNAKRESQSFKDRVLLITQQLIQFRQLFI